MRPGVRRRVEPDWSSLVREAKRPGVNLMVLWEEYRDVHPDGYGYSRFCDLFREFERRISPVMRQHYAAGDKVFVDYSGKKVPIVDPTTGVVREAEIFVAVLGASTFTGGGSVATQLVKPWVSVAALYVSFKAPQLLARQAMLAGLTPSIGGAAAGCRATTAVRPCLLPPLAPL